MSRRKAQAHIPQVYHTRSDVGCVRGHNEDSFAAKSPLFVVADGMGGHEAGEVASEIAVNTMLERIPDQSNPAALAEAVREANRAVLRGAEDGTGKPGMGTTMTAATVFGDELVIAQVGDSRAYLLHDGSLQRLTRDHSLVADFVEQGRITEEEARVHPQRSVITRALGSDPDLEPDLYKLQVEPGDILMLCSDGLSSMIFDEQIEAIMQSNADDLEKCCDALVDETLAAGGLDNVTVVCVDPFASPEAEDGSEAQSTKKKPEGKKVRRAPIVWAVVFVVILVAAAFGFYTYAQHSYYIIAEDGYVCVYKGLPGEVGGLNFSWLEEKTDVQVDKLAASTAARLENGIAVDSLEQAQQQIQVYRETTNPTATADAEKDAEKTPAGKSAEKNG